MRRPEKHNALDLPMFEGLNAGLAEIRKDASIRAVVLSGEGKSFCSGLDFPSFLATADGGVGAMLDKPGDEVANLAQTVAYGWQELPIPVIAALQGSCIGGGAQIALGADIRVGGEDLRFSIRETHWGLIPDMGLTQSLPRLVRSDVAMDLVLTARFVDAAEAAELGLVTRLAPDPLTSARELAATIAALSPDATRRAKLLLDRCWNMSPRDSLALEERLQRELLGSSNQMAAVAAGFSGEPADFIKPTPTDAL